MSRYFNSYLFEKCCLKLVFRILARDKTDNLNTIDGDKLDSQSFMNHI